MADLEGADLRYIKLSDEKHIGPHLADVHWGNTNLAVVDWPAMKMLGDEYEARQTKKARGKRKIILCRMTRGLMSTIQRFEPIVN